MLIPGVQQGIEALQQLGDKLRKLTDTLVGDSNPGLALDGVAAEMNDLAAPLEARARKEPSSPRKTAAVVPPPVVKSGANYIEISSSAWKKLTPALQNKMRTPNSMMEQQLVGLAAQTLKEVARFRPEYVQEAVTRVLNYKGQPALLKGVFDRCQSYDPIALGNDFKVHVLPVGPLSNEHLDMLRAYTGNKCEESSSIEEYTLKSDSGSVLKTSPHIIVRKSNPATIVARGGRELMVSHGEIFFGVTEELIKERRTRLERRVHESVLEVLRGASLTEILHSDELGEAAKRSPLLARNLEAYQELVTVLQKAQHAIQDATYGIGFGVGKAGCVHLKTDHGGQLLSWCEKNAADMPPALQADLELLLYSAQELSIKEQQRIISVLAAFHISHSTINLQVALAPLQQDLAALKALPDSSPHKVPELYEKAMQAIASATKAVSIDTKDEIRLDRLSDLLYTPLHEFRRAVNADLLAVYGDEFFEAVNSFKPFFCEGDNLKPDFRGEGIALESLKQTIYGAELGIRSFEKNIEPSKRFSALSRDDFFNVREAIYYLSISSRDESVSESLCGHLSIPNFKAVVTGVITAHRKATSIDTQYKNWHFDNGHAGLPEPVTSGNHLTAPVSAQLLGTFSPIVVKGRNILPKEEFAEEFGISLNHCVQVRDFLKFGKAHADSSKTIFDQWSFLADAGLYNAGVKDAEQDYLVRNGLRYLPRTVCQDIADRLAPLYRNPFIRIKEERFSSYPFDNRQKLEALFLEKQIVNSAKMFEAVLAEEDIIDAIVFPLSEQDRVNYIDASASRFLLRNHAPVAEGANSFTLVFGLGSTFIGEWKERKVAYTTIDGVQSSFKIQWLDAEGAVSRSRELLASTVPSDQLSTVQSLVSVLSAPSQTRPDTMLGGSMSRASEGERLYENFARRLRVVTLQRALGGSTQGSNPASKRIADELPHWIIAKNNPFRIERALIEDVYQATKIDPEVVTLHSDGWLRLHESSIEVVKGKKHKGVDLYDVLFRDPTYVTKYFAEIFQHKDSSRLIGAVLGAFQRARLAMGGDTGRRRVFIEEFTRSYFGV